MFICAFWPIKGSHSTNGLDSGNMGLHPPCIRAGTAGRCAHLGGVLDGPDGAAYRGCARLLPCSCGELHQGTPQHSLPQRPARPRVPSRRSSAFYVRRWGFVDPKWPTLRTTSRDMEERQDFWVLSDEADSDHYSEVVGKGLCRLLDEKIGF